MEPSLESLLAYIHSLMDFPAQSWERLQPALRPLSLPGDAWLLREGRICEALYYISEGYARAFTEHGVREINLDFFFEGDIATDVASFTRGSPATMSIRAGEPLQVIRFDKELLYAAAREDHLIETLGKRCLGRIAAAREEHRTLDKLPDAGQRYAYIERHHPELIQRVSLTQLASYLGVARETLSRIRSRRT